jgi:hypothetical protein
MMNGSRRKDAPGRAGIGLVEALAAIGLLVAALPPILNWLSVSSRMNHSAAMRLVLELRARRHLAEMSTTSYHVLPSEQEFPVELEEPVDAEGYGPWIQDIDEEATVRHLERGLLEATVRITYRDPGASDHLREIVARRLLASPTSFLESRFSLEGGQ